MIHCSLFAKVRLPGSAVFTSGHAGAHAPLASEMKHVALERWSLELSDGQAPYVQLPSSVVELGSKFDAAESVQPAAPVTAVGADAEHTAATSILGNIHIAGSPSL